MQPGIKPVTSRLYVAHATTEPRRPTQYFNETRVVGNTQYFSENSGCIPVSISMKTQVIDGTQYLQHTCQLAI